MFFVRATSRRQGGMGPNPILPSEVRELAEQLCFPLNAWTAELLYRLDDVVLKARRDESPTSSEPEQTEVAATDAKGVRALLGGIAQRVRLNNEAKAQAAALRKAKGGAK